jgi:hypothetical protein
LRFICDTAPTRAAGAASEGPANEIAQRTDNPETANRRVYRAVLVTVALCGLARNVAKHSPHKDHRRTIVFGSAHGVKHESKTDRLCFSRTTQDVSFLIHRGRCVTESHSKSLEIGGWVTFRYNRTTLS